MEISTYSPSSPNITFEDFKKNLGKFSRNAVIKRGSAILWDKNLPFRNGNKVRLLEAYGPQIIILAFAICNNHGDPHMTRYEFRRLCEDYNSLELPVFAQIDKIINDLKDLIKTNKLDKTFEDYLNPEYFSLIEPFFLISLFKRTQSKSDHITPYELVSTYKILAPLNQEQEISKIFDKIFGVNLLQLIRCAHGLVSLAPQNNGYIDFRSNNTCESLIEKLWDIDLRIIQLIASKISYDASKLELLPYTEKHNSYNPLYAHAMVHLDNIEDPGSYNNLFFIPQPSYFLRGFKNWIFERIKNNHKWKLPFDNKDEDHIKQKPRTIDLRTIMGEAIEEHIGASLKNIFGSNNFKKIPTIEGQKSADFYISLPHCDLVIEQKKNLANDKLLSGNNSYEAWGTLYGACQQCEESIKIYKNPSKPIFAIILSEEHLSWDGLPFQIFALQSKMMEHMGMYGLEIMSWYSLELLLSRTSVEKFSESLVEKWDKKKSLTAADIVNLSVQPSTKPAHNYEYLKDAYDEIFQKIIPFELSNPNQPF